MAKRKSEINRLQERVSKLKTAREYDQGIVNLETRILSRWASRLQAMLSELEHMREGTYAREIAIDVSLLLASQNLDWALRCVTHRAHENHTGYEYRFDGKVPELN